MFWIFDIIKFRIYKNFDICRGIQTAKLINKQFFCSFHRFLFPVHLLHLLLRASRSALGVLLRAARRASLAVRPSRGRARPTPPKAIRKIARYSLILIPKPPKTFDKPLSLRYILCTIYPLHEHCRMHAACMHATMLCSRCTVLCKKVQISQNPAYIDWNRFDLYTKVVQH